MQFFFCPKCGAKQNEPDSDNPACPSCGVFLNKVRATTQEAFAPVEQLEEFDLPQSRFHKIALLVLKIVVAGVVIRYIGMHHIVNGSNIKMQVINKKSFGFDETFINVDALSEIPMAKLKSDYPLSKIALQTAGIFKTDAQIQDEIDATVNQKKDEIINSFNADLKRKNDEAMKVLNSIHEMNTPTN